MCTSSISGVGLQHAAEQLNTTAQRVAKQGASPGDAASLSEAKDTSASSGRAVQTTSRLDQNSIDLYA